ncbi:MAG: hypothetical protein IPN43_00020 [Chitinophagaceae bacterium]|nr:hypothetical protein [Chitinophagaceae bacterium]
MPFHPLHRLVLFWWVSAVIHYRAVLLLFILFSIYIFSNLAAFGVAGLVSFFSGKENIDDYKGFYQTNPFLSWILALALFSLAGIPPTAGFFGKLFLLTAGASTGTYLFIGIAAVNMIISLYYYLRVIRAVFMDKNETPVENLHEPVPRWDFYLWCRYCRLVFQFLL